MALQEVDADATMDLEGRVGILEGLLAGAQQQLAANQQRLDANGKRLGVIADRVETLIACVQGHEEVCPLYRADGPTPR